MSIDMKFYFTAVLAATHSRVS